MTTKRVSLLLGALWVILASAAKAQVPIVLPRDCSLIQRSIDLLPPRGGTVTVRAGNYRCREPIVIDRDNVDLRGEGPATVLRVADGANIPVLILGQSVAVPTTLRKGIHVSGLVVDGNRENQQFECLHGPCTADNPLRNNGISIRRCEDCRVERVTAVRARSGGLVSELGTRRLVVNDFSAFDNHFDGLAAYETEDSTFSRIDLHDNRAAGLSFDIRFNNNIVGDVVITGSGSVGIFMRDAFDNLFHGVQIRRSREHGMFLAQVDDDRSKPAAGNTFSGFVVSESGGAGLRVNDVSCVENLVVASQFVRNLGGCVTEPFAGLVRVFGTICR